MLETRVIVTSIRNIQYGIGQKQLELVTLSRCCELRLIDENSSPWGYECSSCGRREHAKEISNDKFLCTTISLDCSNDQIAWWVAGWLEVEQNLVKVCMS